MRSFMFYAGLMSGFLAVMPARAYAGKITCPDAPEDWHSRETTATSAPEIKVRATSQDNGHRWSQIVRPLTQKAVKAAKTQRALAIEDGIEHACTAPQAYVGQIVPVPGQVTGCDHRVVTRPADSEHIWIQVVAICKYAAGCCTTDDGKMAQAGAAVDYTLEGPLASGVTPAGNVSKSAKK